MWEKIKAKINEFNRGRNGVDELCTATMITGLTLSVLSMLGLRFLGIFSTACYLLTLFRMVSTNLEARRMENRKFLDASKTYRIKWNQFILRRKNSKEYKYFHCPQCHQIIRAKRGSGLKHVTCKKCGKEFDKKC